MARSAHIPKYRRHSSGQARVTINGKDHLLGPYGSAASKVIYQRLIAEWLSSPAKQLAKTEAEESLTVSELVLAYWKFASKHGGFDKTPRRGDYYCVRDALKVVQGLYGPTSAEDFGPLALKACRQSLLGGV